MRRVGAQPLLDLAMAKDEVKARLSPVPVYTVANPKNEFVLIAGDVSRDRRLGCERGKGTFLIVLSTHAAHICKAH